MSTQENRSVANGVETVLIAEERRRDVQLSPKPEASA